MGCDIHLHAEVKVDGRWEHLANPSIDRNYALFAKMANVRNYNDEVQPIAMERGLPSDPSTLTRLDYEHCADDWHSASWLSCDEMLQLKEWLRSQSWSKYSWTLFGIWLFGESIEEWERGSEIYPAEIEDVRLVFWFDN